MWSKNRNISLHYTQRSTTNDIHHRHYQNTPWQRRRHRQLIRTCTFVTRSRRGYRGDCSIPHNINNMKPWWKSSPRRRLSGPKPSRFPWLIIRISLYPSKISVGIPTPTPAVVRQKCQRLKWWRTWYSWITYTRRRFCTTCGIDTCYNSRTLGRDST